MVHYRSCRQKWRKPFTVLFKNILLSKGLGHFFLKKKKRKKSWLVFEKRRSQPECCWTSVTIHAGSRGSRYNPSCCNFPSGNTPAKISLPPLPPPPRCQISTSSFSAFPLRRRDIVHFGIRRTYNSVFTDDSVSLVVCL